MMRVYMTVGKAEGNRSLRGGFSVNDGLLRITVENTFKNMETLYNKYRIFNVVYM